MKRLCWIQLAAASTTIAAAGLVSAQLAAPAVPSARADTRKVIELPAAEQEHVMQEMQRFLVSIHAIMEAILRDDFKGAAAAARMSRPDRAHRHREIDRTKAAARISQARL